MNDFLNAKSMVTPGVAGGLVMLITNTCATQFNLVAKWTALGLSALLALLVVCILVAPLWQKGLLWVLNGLVIFSMAMGANQAGATINTSSDSRQVSGPFPTPSPQPSASATASPVVNRSPAPTPRQIDPKVFRAIVKQPSFFQKW
jgi:hypothetical protein